MNSDNLPRNGRTNVVNVARSACSDLDQKVCFPVGLVIPELNFLMHSTRLNFVPINLDRMSTTIAPATGNQVATPAADELCITRVFNAPRELVFKAWTTPEMLEHWFGCAAFTTTFAEADVRVGGEWRVGMRSQEGDNYLAYGVYKAIVPVKHLALTHQWDRMVVETNPPHHETLVTVDLYIEKGGGTRMEFRQTGLATEASRDSHQGGWSDSFDALAKVLGE